MVTPLKEADQHSTQQKVVQVKPAYTDKYELYVGTVSVKREKESECVCARACECPHMQAYVANCKIEILSAVVCVRERLRVCVCACVKGECETRSVSEWLWIKLRCKLMHNVLSSL